MTDQPQAKDAKVWPRAVDDWYVEPRQVTRQLLHVEHFSGPICDPCCGQGHIVEACLEAGLQAWGLDLRRRVQSPWFLGESDFLGPQSTLLGAADCIFNPPYYRAAGAEACIRRALELAPGKVAVFIDGRFLWGATRGAGFWHDHPPSRVWLVTPRPSCPPGQWLLKGGAAKGGTPDFAWAVWDSWRRPEGSTVTIGWLKA